MKTIVVASVILLVGLARPAFAGCGDGPSTLSQAQLNTILAGNFACGRKVAGVSAPGWNERHLGGPSSGTIQEQHASPVPVENIGTWATSTTGSTPGVPSNVGRVTYSYNGGGPAPVYEVAVVANGACGAGCTSLPQTYQFCGVGGGAPSSLLIRVTTSVLPLASCPSNP